MLERLVFGNRAGVVVAAALVTAAMGWLATSRPAVTADFARMIPARHPFVRNYLAHEAALRGLGNSLRVVVEDTRGGDLEPEAIEALRRATDELVVTAGVDRAWVRSLWMPSVRWTETTEEGVRGGPVMPDGWDGSRGAVEALRRNVARAGLRGTLVSHDGRSTAVFVPLLARDPLSGAPFDERALSRRLDALRAEVEGGSGGRFRVHVVGHAKLAGELADGMFQVAAWFGVAAAVVAAALLAASRCLRGTLAVVGCAGVAAVWQAGIAAALGISVDPFSVLVPFLVLAAGVSHGTQQLNGVLQETARGAARVEAARLAVRRLAPAALPALLTDAAGYAVLGLVDIPAVRRVALTATVGSGVLVVTSLVLLPVVLSYVGVGAAAAARSLGPGDGPGPAAWRALGRLTGRRAARVTVAGAVVVALAAAVAGGEVPVGDRDPGASELRASSRYNRDVAFVREHFGASSDVFAVIVTTARDGCLSRRTLVEADRLGWALRQLPGVQATASLAEAVRQITAGAFEGDPRWLAIPRDPRLLDHAAQQAMTRNPELLDPDCSAIPVIAYLADHTAETLDPVVAAAQRFAREHDGPEARFLVGAGNAVIEAATLDVVREAGPAMTLLVYAAVVLLCRASLRSWRATAVTVIPLAVTSVLCQAAMVPLGVGVRLSTLPAVALGVGLSDFSLYLVSAQLAGLRAGLPLAEAHRRALSSTGRAVVLVGVTLAAAVATWTASPIKLQADLGALLTFTFLVNAAAALVLVPALSRLVLAREEEGP